MRSPIDPVQTPTLRAAVRRRPATIRILAIILFCGLGFSPIWLAAGAPSAVPAKPDSAEPVPVQPGPPAAIDGFRDAHFGMTEEQVRRAVAKDFPGSAAKLKRMVHPSERTTILTLPVSDLLPGTGLAQVSYILGYKSKSLVQVNVVWRSERSRESDETVVATANSLRDYLKERSYKPGSEIANRQLAKGAIVVFRGADAQDRTVIEILNEGPAPARKGEKAPPAPPLTLELSYIADPAHPDIFRIGKGQF